MSLTRSTTRRTAGTVSLLAALLLVLNALFVIAPAGATPDEDRRPCNEYGYEKPDELNQASGSASFDWGSMAWGGTGGAAPNELAYDIAEGYTVEFCLKGGDVDNTHSGPVTGEDSLTHDNPSISHVGYRVVDTPRTDASVDIDQGCPAQGDGPADSSVTLDNANSNVATTFRIDLDGDDPIFEEVAAGASETHSYAANSVLVRWFDVDEDVRKSTSAAFEDLCLQPAGPTVTVVKVFTDPDGTFPDEPFDPTPDFQVDLFDGDGAEPVASATPEDNWGGPVVLDAQTYTVTETVEGFEAVDCAQEVVGEYAGQAQGRSGLGTFDAPTQADIVHVVCNAPTPDEPEDVVDPVASVTIECDTDSFVTLDNTGSNMPVVFTIQGVGDVLIEQEVAGGQTETVPVTLDEDESYAITVAAEGMQDVTAEGTHDCEDPEPEPETEVDPDVVVRPAVSFLDPSCDDPDQAEAVVTPVDGIAYTITGDEEPGGTVTITAVAQDGYTIPASAQSTWTHTFAEADDCVEVAPESTEKPQPAPQPAPEVEAQELAATGLDSVELFLLALLLFGLGAAALLAPEPRRLR